MKRLIVANWKMNPQRSVEAKRLFEAISRAARQLKNVETVICPPFIYLKEAGSMKYESGLGAQDIFWGQNGAYTGEISPKMLKNLGVRWVIIGHSERRRYLGETDEMIAKKVKAALAVGLKVVLCVGETLEERKRGWTMKVIRNQLKKDLKNVWELPICQRVYSKVKSGSVAGNWKLRNRLMIAYEPVWAIGTGLVETPHGADTAAGFIRKIVGANVRVLYGGSVNAKNAESYFAMPNISGALVGGASLRPAEFAKILRAADSNSAD